MQNDLRPRSKQRIYAYPALLSTPDLPAESKDYGQGDYARTILLRFEQYLKTQNISSLYIQDYLTLLLHLIDWFRRTYSGEVTLIDLTPEIFRQYKKHILHTTELTLKPGRQFEALHAVSQWVEQDLKVVEVQDKTNRRSCRSTQWLDKEQQTILIRTIKNDLRLANRHYPKRRLTRHRDAALVIVLLYSGLRLNEVTRLQVDNMQISRDASKISIQHGQGSPHRVIPLNWEAHKALQDWDSVRPKNKFFWSTSSDDQGRAMSGRAVQRILNRYAKAAQIDDLTPMVCRHTFARNLVSSGVRLEYVAALLGLRSLDAVRSYMDESEHRRC